MSDTILNGVIAVDNVGKLSDGQEILEYTLSNSLGSVARILNYGGILTSLQTMDSQGRIAEITLGYDDFSGYLRDENYMGALIGRYANRIANGRFNLNGRPMELSLNDNSLHLHGGVTGFNRIVWETAIITGASGPALKLHHFSPDRQEGYPGNLDVDVIISLNEANELHLVFCAETDLTGIFNPTYHPYFNLNSHQRLDIMNHRLRVEAQQFLPITNDMLPENSPRSVMDTVFDFRREVSIGEMLDDTDDQISRAGGYDNCFVLDGPANTLRTAATVVSPESGRRMVILTDAPGLQFYSGNFLQPGLGLRGRFHQRRHALCLEPQSFPNAPNVETFPSTLIHPGEKYHRTIIYQFNTVDVNIPTSTPTWNA